MKKSLPTTLNYLLKHLHDSRYNYQECVEHITDQKLVNLFHLLSSSRHEMINELKKIVTSLGEKPIETGSLANSLHRIFIDLKLVVNAGNAQMIVDEIKRGENVTINCYKDVLLEEIPDNIRAIICTQLSEIERNLESIDALYLSHKN